MLCESVPDTLLGQVAHDPHTATNERILIRAPRENRPRLLRNQFVVITDALTPSTTFLGRLLTGPFFRRDMSDDIVAEVEIQGELDGLYTRDTNNRPSTGSPVHEMQAGMVREMLGFDGDVLLGCMSGREDLKVSLSSMSKDVLPRNVGIFGTVGSGKSNTVQVLVEEASARGWAVILLALESEYVDIEQPKGLDDFHVYYPVSCASDRADSQPFTLRIADFDSSITAELLQVTMGERN